MIASLGNLTYGMNISISERKEMKFILDLIDFIFKLKNFF